MNEDDMPLQGVDRLDFRLLDALRQEGRASYEALGQIVGLSASSVLRRVRRLEEAGVITGYAAKIDPRQIGLGLTAYVQVRMVKHAAGQRRSPLEAFAVSAQGWPEVAEGVALTGEMDCLLKVVVPDMDRFSEFVMDRLLQHPSVQDCRSSFVMRAIKG